MNVKEFLKGKKGYIIGLGIIVISVFLLVTKFDIVDIPAFAWMLIEAGGFAAVRAGISSASKDDNKGWKSYAASVGLALCGVLKMFGIILPPEVYVAFEGLGLVGIRGAVSKINKAK